MRWKSQVRFGERGRRNRIWQHVYDAPASTLRDPTPSPDDIAVTRAIIDAGELLDVQVLDHLVIGRDRWVSLKERKLGFS